jgi:hypothetical protein
MTSQTHGPRNVISTLCLAATFAVSLLTIGCEEHHYRVYDSYYSDYHVWDLNEVTYYHRWANERRYDPNRDFRKIPPPEQKDYWDWRHKNH